jgi:hypothetical protein
VQGTADKYLAALEQALQVGDLLTAMRAWEAVEVMQQTWDLEPQPFFNREPYAAPWKALRRRMSGEITAALDCQSRDKTFRYVASSGTDGAASIACE